MWFTARSFIAILVLAVLVAAGYAELVLDIRAPRVVVDEAAVVNTEAGLGSRSDAFDARMKAKYGPKAATFFQPKPASWVVEIDGKVVYREPATMRFGAAFGFFVIGAPGRLASLFPFRLGLEDKQPSHRYPLAELRQWYEDVNNYDMVRYLEVSDAGEVEGPCTYLEPSDVGLAGKLLSVRTGRFCLIPATAGRYGSALIGVVVADGDPWMRPFTGRICRGLTELALRKIAAARPRPPEYAACLMVDRPTRMGTTEVLRFHDFGVGADGKLARTLSSNTADALPRLR